MLGVCMPPVMAQLMITLAMALFPPRAIPQHVPCGGGGVNPPVRLARAAAFGGRVTH
jgi:hypothetical protein